MTDDKRNKLRSDGRAQRVGRWYSETGEDDWFVPKMFGIGATPVKWQGWALILALVAGITGIAISQLPLWAKIVFGIAMFANFTIVAIRKTRGGWRWRWGMPPER